MISVIIITHNRRNALLDCLESILRQGWSRREIIVVDNGSTDGTSEVLKKRYQGRLILIRNDTIQDLAYCKSMGVKQASGSIVAFTDDDCFVSKDWLHAIAQSFSQPDYDIVAGSVVPLRKLHFPFWWRSSLNWTIGLCNINSHKFMPLGCNLAFRKKVFQDLDQYLQNSSRMRGIVYCEDTLRIKRALFKGYKMSLNPDMVVYHNISYKKLSLRYMLQRSWTEGREWACIERENKILIKRIIAILINPFRFIFTLDLNHLLRVIVSLAYMRTYFK